MALSDTLVGSRQAPLRRLYVKEPEQALITKRARSGPRDDALHCRVSPGTSYGVTLDLGVDRAIGGYHDAPNPAELLCAALASCKDTSIRMVADLLGIAIVELTVDVTGEVDVRGCLSVDPEVRVGFKNMRCDVHLEVAEQTDPRLLKLLIKQAEHACVNLETLRNGVPVEVDFDVTHAGTDRTAQSGGRA